MTDDSPFGVFVSTNVNTAAERLLFSVGRRGGVPLSGKSTPDCPLDSCPMEKDKYEGKDAESDRKRQNLRMSIRAVVM